MVLERLVHEGPQASVEVRLLLAVEHDVEPGEAACGLAQRAFRRLRLAARTVDRPQTIVGPVNGADAAFAIRPTETAFG